MCDDGCVEESRKGAIARAYERAKSASISKDGILRVPGA